MATWQHRCAVIGAMALAGMMNVSEAWAQADDAGSVRIRKIDFRQMTDPTLRVNNPNSGNADWHRLTAEFDTSRPWLDELEVVHYVLFAPDAGDADLRTQAEVLLLRGQTFYVNVKRGSHISELYIHPNTIDRFGPIERIAVVIKVRGRTLAVESDPQTRDAWWEQLSPIDGLILKSTQTPYNVISPDHHEATKAVAIGVR